MHLSFAQAGTAGAGLATAEHAEHARLLATLLAEEFPHLSDAGGLLHAQALMRIVNTLVHDAITLPEHDRDRVVVEHFNAFASGYNRALKGRVAT